MRVYPNRGRAWAISRMRIRSADVSRVIERSNAATEERLRSGHAVGGGQYR